LLSSLAAHAAVGTLPAYAATPRRTLGCSSRRRRVGFSHFFVALSAATPLAALPAPDLLDAIGKKYGITTLGPPMMQ